MVEIVINQPFYDYLNQYLRYYFFGYNRV